MRTFQTLTNMFKIQLVNKRGVLLLELGSALQQSDPDLKWASCFLKVLFFLCQALKRMSVVKFGCQMVHNLKSLFCIWIDIFLVKIYFLKKNSYDLKMKIVWNILDWKWARDYSDNSSWFSLWSSCIRSLRAIVKLGQSLLH